MPGRVTLNCPTCGLFSSDCSVQQMSTQNGWNEYYEGTCKRCGRWGDSAA